MEESVNDEARSSLVRVPDDEQSPGKVPATSFSAAPSKKAVASGEQFTEPFPDVVEIATPSNGVAINGTTAATTSTPPPLSTSISSTTVPDRSRPVSGIVPPWWRHSRKYSRASVSSADTFSRKPTISLEDHTKDPNSSTSRGLWAKNVTIDDHVVVQGKTGVGAYTVWICKIQMLDGGPMMIRMRYSEFDELRHRLASAFPHAKSALPPLPPKSVLFKFRSSFLETRRIGLQYFLNCVLLNPEFSGSPVLKDFLFTHLG